MLPAVIGEFRAAADPELRFSPSGIAVARLRAVASSRKKLDDGTWIDDKTVWVNLTAFKKVAENMAESFQKGDLLVVTGKLQIDEWEDREGGKRTSVDILIDTIGHSTAFNPSRSIKTDRPPVAPPQHGTAQENDPWAAQFSPTNQSNPPPVYSDAPPF